MSQTLPTLNPLTQKRAKKSLLWSEKMRPKSLPRTDLDHPTIQRALALARADQNSQNQHTKNLNDIDELMHGLFQINAPSRLDMFPSVLGRQLYESVIKKFRTPSFRLWDERADKATTKLVNQGMEWVLEKSNWIRTMQGAKGVYSTMLRQGDGIVQLRHNPTCSFPFQFERIEISKIYFDQMAETMRGSERAVSQMLVVMEYTYDQVLEMYPHYAGTYGRIPLSPNQAKIKSGIFENHQYEKDLVELAFYYDFVRREYCIFGGASLAIIPQNTGAGKKAEVLAGENFPFVTLNDEVEKPFFQLVCFPVFNSVRNAGLGHLAYKLSELQKLLLHASSLQIVDNTNPLKYLNVSASNKENFLSDLENALEAQAQGLPAVIINELATSLDNFNPSLVALQSPNVTSDLEKLLHLINQVFLRFGFNLDQASISASKRLGVAEIEEESQSETIEQIQEQNTPEMEAMLYSMMNLLKRFVVPSNPTLYKMPIGLLTAEKTQLTLGDLAEALRKYDFIVELNTRSGVVNSRTLERHYRQQVLPLMNPESPVYKKTIREMISDYLGANISDEDLATNPPLSDAPLTE